MGPIEFGERGCLFIGGTSSSVCLSCQAIRRLLRQHCGVLSVRLVGGWDDNPRQYASSTVVVHTHRAGRHEDPVDGGCLHTGPGRYGTCSAETIAGAGGLNQEHGRWHWQWGTGLWFIGGIERLEHACWCAEVLQAAVLLHAFHLLNGRPYSFGIKRPSDHVSSGGGIFALVDDIVLYRRETASDEVVRLRRALDNARCCHHRVFGQSPTQVLANRRKP